MLLRPSRGVIECRYLEVTAKDGVVVKKNDRTLSFFIWQKEEQYSNFLRGDGPKRTPLKCIHEDGFPLFDHLKSSNQMTETNPAHTVIIN